MPDPAFTADLERYGPQAKPARPPSLRAARRYCRRLARRHYENFTAATWLLPPRLRQHFSNVYAYCRWADDLADETGDPRRRLALLDWWEDELRACYRDRATHPVFVALADTVSRFTIPLQPFADLLVAFRQDQRMTRYETFDAVLDYCRHSANPVGRLVLCLGGCCDAARAELADSVCTGLQLANFAQDVARDWRSGRIYFPLAECRRFGYDEPMFARREYNAAFRQLITAQVDRADAYLRRGLPLVGMMPSELRVPVALFIRGGLAILEAIRRQDYNVWASRPVVSKAQKLRLLARCWWQVRRGTFNPSAR